GDDAPTVEGGAVGAGGALRAGASRDVAERLGRKALAREVLELAGLAWQLWNRPGHPVEVDLVLIVRERLLTHGGEHPTSAGTRGAGSAAGHRRVLACVRS